jgi:hypothetical protein
MNELGDVAADRKNNLDLVLGAFACVVLGEAFAQGTEVDANDGVFVRFKVRLTSQPLHRNAVFIKRGNITLEVFFAQVGECADQTGRSPEHLGGEDDL